MRTLLLSALVFAVTSSPVAAQMRIDVMYGFERNVESSEPEYDGWLGATVEWEVGRGLSLGLGSDHQFESARPSASQHESTAVFVTVRRTFAVGAVAPYVRLGVGVGRAPCEGDTCSDGAYLRGAAGLGSDFDGPLQLIAEVGMSRVGRPLVGAGLSYRPGL